MFKLCEKRVRERERREFWSVANRSSARRQCGFSHVRFFVFSLHSLPLHLFLSLLCRRLLRWRVVGIAADREIERKRDSKTPKLQVSSSWAVRLQMQQQQQKQQQQEKKAVKLSAKAYRRQSEKGPSASSRLVNFSHCLFFFFPLFPLLNSITSTCTTQSCSSDRRHSLTLWSLRWSDGKHFFLHEHHFTVLACTLWLSTVCIGCSKWWSVSALCCCCCCRSCHCRTI